MSEPCEITTSDLGQFVSHQMQLPGACAQKYMDTLSTDIHVNYVPAVCAHKYIIQRVLCMYFICTLVPIYSSIEIQCTKYTHTYRCTILRILHAIYSNDANTIQFTPCKLFFGPSCKLTCKMRENLHLWSCSLASWLVVDKIDISESIHTASNLLYNMWQKCA